MNCGCDKIVKQIYKLINIAKTELDNPSNIGTVTSISIKQNCLSIIDECDVSNCNCYIGENLRMIRNFCIDYKTLDKNDLTYNVKVERLFDKIIITMYNIRNASY